MTFIVFDIGGTNMRVAKATLDSLGEIKKVPTPKDPVDGIALLKELAKEFEGSFIAAGGDIAGRVREDGTLSDARNLPAWNGVNVTQKISEALGVPAHVYNDAVVVGLGEAHVGAGKGHARVAYITVSTGVGGALVEEGNLATSPLLGDVALKVGDLESLISGTAIQKKFGIQPKDLDSLDERNKLADILATGLAEVNEVWRPDVFVVGGSMIVGINPIPIERVMQTLSGLSGVPLTVNMATLGDNGGLEGGRVLARQMLE